MASKRTQERYGSEPAAKKPKLNLRWRTTPQPKRKVIAAKAERGMADKRTHDNDGSEPTAKKTKLIAVEAQRAQRHLSSIQPGRVHLIEIGFYPHNRGGQGIMPPHVHNIAFDAVSYTHLTLPTKRIV